MTRTIQNTSTITVEGRRTGKNCKPVYCITTGKIYASVIDAAEAVEAAPSSMVWALTGRTRTCKGMRWCYVANVMEYLEEITESNRVMAENNQAIMEKAKSFDLIVERQEAIDRIQKELDKARVKNVKLQKEIEELTASMEDNTEKIKAYEEKLNYLRTAGLEVNILNKTIQITNLLK